MSVEVKSQPTSGLGGVIAGGAIGVGLSFAAALAGSGIAGMLVIGGLAALTAAGITMAISGRPAFVITDTGITLATLRSEIAWNEIEMIEEKGSDLENLRLQLVVHDSKAITSRARGVSRGILELHGLFGLLGRRLALYVWDTQLSLDQLEQELNRRAGRQIVGRRVWGTSLWSRYRRWYAYTGQERRTRSDERSA
jgi:hypothetical protein